MLSGTTFLSIIGIKVLPLASYCYGIVRYDKTKKMTKQAFGEMLVRHRMNAMIRLRLSNKRQVILSKTRVLGLAKNMTFYGMAAIAHNIRKGAKFLTRYGLPEPV